MKYKVKSVWSHRPPVFFQVFIGGHSGFIHFLFTVHSIHINFLLPPSRVSCLTPTTSCHRDLGFCMRVKLPNHFFFFFFLNVSPFTLKHMRKILVQNKNSFQ